MHHSEQKYAHLCFEWCVMVYGIDASWDLWDWYITHTVHTVVVRHRFHPIITRTSHELHGIWNYCQLNCIFSSLFETNNEQHQSSPLLGLFGGEYIRSNYWQLDCLFSSLLKLTTNNIKVLLYYPFLEGNLSVQIIGNLAVYGKRFHVTASPWLFRIMRLSNFRWSNPEEFGKLITWSLKE